MANNEIHDVQIVQSKHSSLTEMNNDESKTCLQPTMNNNSSDINHEDYKETIDPTSAVKNDKTSINDQSTVSSFDDTIQSTQSDSAQNDATSSKIQHYNKPLKRTDQDHTLNEDDNNNNRHRSLSSSSSSSSSTSSSSSDNQTSNIPYEILNNDEDDDPSEHTKESTNQMSS